MLCEFFFNLKHRKHTWLLVCALKIKGAKQCSCWVMEPKNELRQADLVCEHLPCCLSHDISHQTLCVCIFQMLNVPNDKGATNVLLYNHKHMYPECIKKYHYNRYKFKIVVLGMSMSIKKIIVQIRRNTRNQLWGKKEMASKHVALGFLCVFVQKMTTRKSIMCCYY